MIESISDIKMIEFDETETVFKSMMDTLKNSYYHYILRIRTKKNSAFIGLNSKVSEEQSRLNLIISQLKF